MLQLQDFWGTLILLANMPNPSTVLSICLLELAAVRIIIHQTGWSSRGHLFRFGVCNMICIHCNTIYRYIMSDHLQPHCNLQTNTTKKLQHATNEWTRIVLLQFAHLSFVVFHVQKGQTSNKSMRIIENRFGSARLAIFVGGLWHKMICCCLRCLPQTLGYLLYIYTLIPSQGDEG